MVKTNTTILREGRQFEVDAGTVTTGTLTDSDDDAAWETLRELGYESGDFIPLLTWDRMATQNTSSSSYSSLHFSVRANIKWDDVLPAANTGVAVTTSTADNGDAVDLRVRNTTDGETAVEETGLGTTYKTLGPTSYRPTTTGSNTITEVQFKNQDGSTSIDVDDTVMMLGVIL